MCAFAASGIGCPKEISSKNAVLYVSVPADKQNLLGVKSNAKHSQTVLMSWGPPSEPRPWQNPEGCKPAWGPPGGPRLVSFAAISLNGRQENG